MNSIDARVQRHSIYLNFTLIQSNKNAWPLTKYSQYNETGNTVKLASIILAKLGSS